MGNKAAKQLGERPLEHPLALSASATLVALQSRPEREMGVLETSGRVCQNDAGKTVIGWVDKNGVAYRNDYNRTVVGQVNLETGDVCQADYNKTKVGRVDMATGFVYFSTSVAHASATTSPFGQVKGPPEAYIYGACALLTLWG